MAGGVRLKPTPGPCSGWPALAALLAVGALLAWPLPASLLDWQPGLATTEPWRAFSAAFVHWSPAHLAGNLAAAAAVAAYGWAARLPLAATGAWLAAWPLTQLGLLTRPELLHYGGLSGVLHAGVAVAALWLAAEDRGARRAVGLLTLAALLLKTVLERPWAEALVAAGDIAVAPAAHASGVLAGLVCTTAVLGWRHTRGR